MSSDSGYAGNVNPGAMVPFGMVNFGPNTPRSDFNGSGGYLSSGSTGGQLDFFSMRHLNGVGCPGQGAVAMLPSTTGSAVASASGRPVKIAYNYADEAAEPGYYKVKLANGIKTELTATLRTGSARITYPDSSKGYFAIDAKLNGNSDSGSATAIAAKNVSLALGSDGRSLSGQAVAPAFCTPYGTIWNSPVYFYASFDKPLRAQSGKSTVNTVVNGAAVLQFDLATTDPVVNVKIGISSVSIANAKDNLSKENADQTFDAVRTQASAAWNDRLNTIQIDQAANPGTLNATQKANLTKFYTALYRVFGSPTVYSDANGEFRSMRQPKDANGTYPTTVDRTGAIPARDTAKVGDYSYRQADGSTGGYRTHYTGFSLWDTYRSQAQLLAWLAPKESGDILQSLTVDALQCGAFPHWVDASDDSTPMAGDNALNVIAGAYKFGATNFDLVSAARLTKQSVFDPSSACNNNASSPNLASYLTTHYYTDSGHPSSEQIERILSDRSAAAFLKALPASVLADASVQVTQADIGTLFARASWWTNIFDATNKRLAARSAPPSGSPPGTLGPLVAGSFHESTEPNYFWTFAQDWSALIKAIGGKSAAVTRLNTLFSIDSALTVTPSSSQLNGGESSNGYYIGNEPSFQAPWAYNWAGAPSAAQYIIPIVMRETFSTGRDGLPGNDDMGAMSSWYVWAALGLYPVVPSESGLAMSTPQFGGMTVWFGNGKKLRIETDKQAVDDRAPFIRALKVNGTAYAGSWLPLQTVADGGTLSYMLSSTATDWAAAENLTPPSGPNADYTRMTAAGPTAAPAR
ncbi:glycoside hydrolase domain-containing protein [Burkholderia alba]|uniref:glycoside hydrolase domain-containing protein n=1 Tax=Burkholderia alba TaxID=2683677 RepID=UPI002B057B24|nr:glycoside hydrolase domain-containing protein [Burkholderia alba]